MKLGVELVPLNPLIVTALPPRVTDQVTFAEAGVQPDVTSGLGPVDGIAIDVDELFKRGLQLTEFPPPPLSTVIVNGVVVFHEVYPFELADK